MNVLRTGTAFDSAASADLPERYQAKRKRLIWRSQLNLRVRNRLLVAASVCRLWLKTS